MTDMNDIQLMIGGRDVPAAAERRSRGVIRCPGDVVTRAAAASVEDARRAADAAASAFPMWAATGPSARRAKLLKAADLLESRAPQLPTR